MEDHLQVEQPNRQFAIAIECSPLLISGWLSANFLLGIGSFFLTDAIPVWSYQMDVGK